MRPTAYVTTPIYYPSGKPHVGHGYCDIAADVYARFKRLDGYDVKFLTGTDEHGLKIQRSAEKEGLAPLAYLDGIVEHFKALTPALTLSNDDFIRTTEDRHKKTAVALWNRLVEKGFIYKATYAGWYSVPDETFYTEDELVDGKSPDSGHPVEWVEEESYFFKLSAFTDKLLAYYEAHPDFIFPKSRYNEVLSFVKGGLRDLAVSRSTFTWGIPVPGDEKHIMYVWIDALTNYLSALGWPDGENMRYWPAVHVMAKDILRFHAVYWPAFLMAADVEMPLRIVAHGWLTVEGRKISKSFGNAIDPLDAAALVGVDGLRYYLMREVTFGNDGDYSQNRLLTRVNSELANEFGNLFQRVLSMVNKNCEGVVPEAGTLTADDEAFLNLFPKIVADMRGHLNALSFSKALDSLWEGVTAANKYMDVHQPWMLKKEDPARMATVLRVLVESFTYMSVLMEPFMPTSAKKVQAQVGFEGKTWADLAGNALDFRLVTGAALPVPAGVFMRVAVEGAVA